MTPREELEQLRGMEGLSPRQELARLRSLDNQRPSLSVPLGEMSTDIQIPAPTEVSMPPEFQGLQMEEVIEPAATIASGVAAEPLAGLAGIATLPFSDATKAEENIESVREALTFVPRTPKGMEALQKVAEALQPVGDALEATEKFLGGHGDELAGPVAGAVGETLPTAGLLALSRVKSVLNLKKSSSDKVVKKLLGDASPTVDNLKGAARGIYNELDEIGAVVGSGGINKLGADLAKLAKKEGIDNTLHPKSSAALNKIMSSNTDLSLTEIDTLRKVAKSAAQSIDPSDARMGVLMVDKVDDFLDGLKSSDFVSGNTKGVGTKYKEARTLWGRAKKAELLDDAFEKAMNQASGFENGIRTQFRSLLNNKKKMRGFSAEEKSLMQKVVRGGTAENMAKRLGKLGFGEGQATSMLMGSLGVGLGATIGGAPGAVAVPLVGTMSRKLAQKLTRNNASFSNAVVRAGKDGDKIVRAYIKSVPAKERSVAELTELLIRPGVNIKNIATNIAKPNEVQKLTANAAFFAEFLQAQKNQKLHPKNLTSDPLDFNSLASQFSKESSDSAGLNQ